MKCGLFKFQKLNSLPAVGWLLIACMLLMLTSTGCEPRPVRKKAAQKEAAKQHVEEHAVTEAKEEGGEEKPPAKVSVEKIIDKVIEAEEAIAAMAPKITECRWAADPIKIDGVGDDKAWEKAELIESFIIPWLKGDAARPPKTATKARVMWDKEYFYFLADMEDADLYADVTKQDGELWNNDVFEIFFKPSKDKPNYYEFEISPNNTKLDMHIPMRSAGGYLRFKDTQEFHIDSAVKLHGTLNIWEDKDEGWTLEGRMPWSDFKPTGGAPKADDMWDYALCRYDYSVAFEGQELSTTAPLRYVNFHLWEDYTPLKFIGPGDTSLHKPFGLEKRVAMTTSRVIGSPEPPLPYRPVATYPNMTLRQPLNLYPEPGTDKLMLIQHFGSWNGPGSIVRIPSDEQAKDSDIEQVIELKTYIAYGLAYHPKYLENGYLYVGMNGPINAASADKKTRVARFTVDRKTGKVDPASEMTIIEWPSDGHNGGDLGFSPKDGFLYITSGDGTSDSDTNLTGQDITNLNATMIRIDIDKPTSEKPYSIPADNPFIGFKVDGKEACPEIWAYGFRNPWRMTFDPQTGHLWVGQNGQDLWEQVIFVRKGENYGWSVMEGGHPFYLERKQGPTPLVAPLIDHPHAEARSLCGGRVYYGKKLPELYGCYIYGDWSTGKIWAVKYDGEKILFHQEIADTTLQIGGFGLDHEGELFVLDQGGGNKIAGNSIYRLEPTPEEIKTAEFPRKLSDTGLFVDVAKHEVQPALINYSVNAPQWSDGADAVRYFGVEGTAPQRMPGGRGWDLPDNSVVIKTLTMEMEPGNPASRKRIETQLMTRQQKEWAAYTYAWNDEQTDAVLVDKNGSEKILEIKDPAAKGGVRKQAWNFAARTDCMACHSRASNYLLGLCEPQLNKVHDYGDASDNQLRTYAHIGLVEVKLAEHINLWFNDLNSLTYKPVAALVWLTKIFEKPVVAVEEPKYVAPPATPAVPAPAEATAAKVVWTFPDDLALALPVPVEWTRQHAIQLRNEFQGLLTSIDRNVTNLAKSPAEFTKLVNPYDETADLDLRARSYLHANCSQCHVEAGGGNAAIVLEFNRKSPETALFTVPPKHDKFDLAGAELVAPGDPDRSVLLYRISKLGGGRMPRVGSSEVDVKAEKMLRQWIASMPKASNDSEFEKQRNEINAIVKDLATPGKLKGDEQKAKATQLLSTTNGALALLAAVDSGALKGAEKDQLLALAEKHEQPSVRDLFERFVPLDERVKRLGPNIDRQQLLAVSGNLERGKDLFFKVASVNCKSCHRIGTGPEQLGPDLNEIGKKYTRAELLDHIVEPSKKVDQKYAAYVVQSSDGRVLSGLLLKQSDEEVVLKTADNKEVRLPKEDVEEMIVSTKSIMPDQLLRDLTAQQAADLLEYLSSLKPVEATASTQSSN